MKNKLTVTNDQNQANNVNVQQQLMEAEKLLKEAALNLGGAGTLRARNIRKEDCHAEK